MHVSLAVYKICAWEYLAAACIVSHGFNTPLSGPGKWYYASLLPIGLPPHLITYVYDKLEFITSPVHSIHFLGYICVTTAVPNTASCPLESLPFLIQPAVP